MGIGGGHVAKGYYGLPEKTEEDFFNDHGKRWFKTGDIGQMMPNGNIKIIDRKKDLVKLQLGEYVSLGKVESQMKTNPLVDNICVYADSTKPNTVAMIVPIREALEKLVRSPENATIPYEVLCKDEAVTKLVLKKLMEHGKNNGLEKFEIPTVLTLY